jgi:hypothetical protein
MEHNPSKIIPPAETELKNAALHEAVAAIQNVRDYPFFNSMEGPSRDEVADALAAILDLVAPHWRMAQEDKR